MQILVKISSQFLFVNPQCLENVLQEDQLQGTFSHDSTIITGKISLFTSS
jgi:hypothetical protein